MNSALRATILIADDDLTTLTSLGGLVDPHFRADQVCSDRLGRRLSGSPAGFCFDMPMGGLMQGGR
jgi:hypothetical protein